jgi:glucokinase
VIGINLGGTHTSIGFVDAEEKCIYETSILTLSKQGAEQLCEKSFSECAKSFKQFENECELVGIGMGAPNGNYYKGTIEYPPNVNWGYVNVIDSVKKYSSLPWPRAARPRRLLERNSRYYYGLST